MTRIVKHFARTVETEVTKMEEEMEDEDKDQHEDSRKLNEEVTLKEVSRAIQCLKNHKAPGQDGVIGEILKAGKKKIQKAVWKLCTFAWSTRE